jgi:lipopolysaccharide/colanic/teichoic acid biosynthesis glycosyltransferase
MTEIAPDESPPRGALRRESEQSAPVQRPLRRAAYLVVKRACDLIGSAIALALLSPLFLLLALTILLIEGRPVLYRREVVGLDGRRFRMLKFRTMRVRAEEMLQEDSDLYAAYREQNYKLRVDHRVTWLGRFLRKYSLDELPQFWNVLRGQMSLVGPRCVPEVELVEFGEFAALRQTMPPGLTGLWQVSGRADRSYTDRIRLDREYIFRSSFWLDLSILLRTLPAVARGVGAY